jgi:cell wall integrity and stress response component
MFSIKFISALTAATSLLTMASAATASTASSSVAQIPTPSVTLPANAMTNVGCFATGTPLENHGYYKFQSDGNCQLICIMLKKNVLGLSDGTDCWCGDKIPAKEWQLPDGNCSTTCAGNDKSTCTLIGWPGFGTC